MLDLQLTEWWEEYFLVSCSMVSVTWLSLQEHTCTCNGPLCNKHSFIPKHYGKQAGMQTSVLMCYNQLIFKTGLWHFRSEFTTKKKGSDHKWGRGREMTSYSIRMSQFYIKLSTRLKFSLNFNTMAHKIFYFKFSLVFKAS